jgi:hypothetical protein
MSEPMLVIVKDGEVTTRPFNDAELKQLKKDKEKEEAFKAEMLPKEQAIADKKAAAEAKLAALGLTSDDLKALGIN